MRIHVRLGWFVSAAFVAVPCWAAPSVTLTETYDGTLEEAAWTVGGFQETDVLQQILPSGGRPGAHLRVQLGNTVPFVTTVAGDASLPFLGNFRARGVISAGVDLQFAVTPSSEGFPVLLVLASDMGTPEDPYDDCEALSDVKNVPRGTGWKSFEFRIPSQTTEQPWGMRPIPGLGGRCGSNLPDGHARWNYLIEHVTRVYFQVNDFGPWEFGVDNPRITLRP